MDNTLIFATEVALSLVLSIAILVRLQKLLREVGAALCEKGGIGTDFWIAYFQLMVIIAPLTIVTYFSKAGHFSALVPQMQHSLFLLLIAQFIGLALVGRAVWNAAFPKAPTPRVYVPNAPIAPAPMRKEQTT
ncbi:hypothetical protein [Usitatibacter palustris]|uniref:Uncharacterized protein n=1 Tax=Usitatibacter palustris TaxID=2732487 RepID=A0A6M4HA16_9PROT|nr:hypothetical protein [Usitatibacter palustris]QJR16015.1 hypothetical protein DSM104440_02843 [Usitatibacter palustris]